MSPHPSDPTVARLIRHVRLGAATTELPTRTRTAGAHGARQHSVGGLVLEASRTDAGVSEEVAQARREVIAAEFERRRMVEAAEETRRRADADRAQAERERDEAVARARRQGGPDPDFLTLALIAVATFELADSDLIHVIDAAVTDDPELSTTDASDLAGEPRGGLTPNQLSAELATAGASPEAIDGLPHTGVDAVPPAELIGRKSEPTTPSVAQTPDVAPKAEHSPAVN